MTPADVWIIVLDIFSFGWVPQWAWIGALVWIVVAVVTGLVVGPWLRRNQRRYPRPVSPVHRCADAGE